MTRLIPRPTGGLLYGSIRCTPSSSATRMRSSTTPPTTHYDDANNDSPSSSSQHQTQKSSSSGNGLTGSDKFFQDALRQEAQEASRPTGADKLLQEALLLEKEESALLSKSSRTQDPNDPIWTGVERVQDTVLRMVVDKYKPLRIPLGDASKNPADEKIKAGVQTPTSPGTPPPSSSSFQSFVDPGTDGKHEEGRKLPKTPDEKPWRAVYVRPVGLGLGAGEDCKPSIYYGQFLKSSSSSSNNLGGKSGSSEMWAKLKAAGINVGALPLDDPKAMGQLRAGLKVAKRRGKLLRARDSILDYQLSRSFLDESESGGAKGDELSDTNKDLQYQLGHAQGWDSVIEKRIKAALDSGLFKENKLRGKPIKRDMEEKNPFLAREEYFMNRIVKRQGAAPPWVELNIELESELGHWKTRVTDSWIRRASRMITTSTTLAEGLEPLPLTASVGPNAIPPESVSAAGEEVGSLDPTITPTANGAEAKLVLEIPAARTPGEQRLIDVATRYRDPEWEERERTYHTHELKRLNDLIRKHNHLAPFTARKGLMILDVELGAMYTRALPKLVYEISSVLHQKLNGGSGAATDGWGENLHQKGDGGGGLVSYDMWGREIRPKTTTQEEKKGMLDGWWGNAIASKGDGKTAEYGVDGAKGAEKVEEDKVMNLGLMEAIQKSLRWARQQIRV